MSRNRLGEQGGIAISEALKVNTSITNIDLSRNYIGEQGGIAISEALKVNSFITNIDLY